MGSVPRSAAAGTLGTRLRGNADQLREITSEVGEANSIADRLCVAPGCASPASVSAAVF